jgi:ribose 1,5-bisphosphokinase
VRPGRLLLVVGPSGVGKDTLLDYARTKLASDPRIRFVRRVITRAASPGEDHEPIDDQAFDQRSARGEFALQWDAHGLRYGIPAAIEGWLARGDTVVVNGSRRIIRDARRVYPSLEVIGISASEQAIAERLAQRGREDEAAIGARLARSRTMAFDVGDALMIDNSGEIPVAGEALVAALARRECLDGAVQEGCKS